LLRLVIPSIDCPFFRSATISTSWIALRPYQFTKYAAFLNPEPVLILAGAQDTKGIIEATAKTYEKEFLDNMIEEVAEMSQKIYR